MERDPGSENRRMNRWKWGFPWVSSWIPKSLSPSHDAPRSTPRAEALPENGCGFRQGTELQISRWVGATKVITNHQTLRKTHGKKPNIIKNHQKSMRGIVNPPCAGPTSQACLCSTSLFSAPNALWSSSAADGCGAGFLPPFVRRWHCPEHVYKSGEKASSIIHRFMMFMNLPTFTPFSDLWVHWFLQKLEALEAAERVPRRSPEGFPTSGSGYSTGRCSSWWLCPTGGSLGRPWDQFPKKSQQMKWKESGISGLLL